MNDTNANHATRDLPAPPPREVREAWDRETTNYVETLEEIAGVAAKLGCGSLHSIGMNVWYHNGSGVFPLTKTQLIQERGRAMVRGDHPDGSTRSIPVDRCAASIDHAAVLMHRSLGSQEAA